MRFWVFPLLLMLLPGISYAQDISSRYFSVKLHNSVNEDDVVRRISSGPIKHPDLLAAPQATGFLAVVLDDLYLEAADILDINLHDFKINLELFSTKEDLNRFFKAVFKQDLKSKAFYVLANNTLYSSLDLIDAAVLAHEVAHAVICRYFVVNPPEKLQEVMCGYVEYSIKKRSKSAAD